MNSTHAAPLPSRKSALTAGIFLLVMGVVAALSFGYVYRSLIAPGNAATTFINLQTSTTLFTAGVAGWVIILICDVVVAWALYVFLRKVNRNLSLLTAGIRMVYAVVLGIAILNLVYILILLNGGELSFASKPLDAQVMSFLQSFEDNWSFGLIIFGLHLVLLGYLAFIASYVPKFWGILLIIAGVCYLFVHALPVIAPSSQSFVSQLEPILSIPMTIGELGFALWLIIRGGKVRKQKPA